MPPVPPGSASTASARANPPHASVFGAPATPCPARIRRKGGGAVVTAMTPAQLTDEVLAEYARAPDPRLRELLAALIGHLHAFAAQTRLTQREWEAAIAFLTATGHKTTAERQEFIL